MTEAHVANLAAPTAEVFTDAELAAFELAERLWANAGAAGADDALQARLRRHFDDAQLLELTWAIGQFIGLGKMIAFFGLERDE